MVLLLCRGRGESARLVLDSRAAWFYNRAPNTEHRTPIKLCFAIGGGSFRNDAHSVQVETASFRVSTTCSCFSAHFR